MSLFPATQLGETFRAAPTLLHELRESIVMTSTNQHFMNYEFVFNFQE